MKILETWTRKGLPGDISAVAELQPALDSFVICLITESWLFCFNLESTDEHNSH